MFYGNGNGKGYMVIMVMSLNVIKCEYVINNYLNNWY